MVLEALGTLLSGKAKTVKPKKPKAEASTTTTEEADKIRASMDARETKATEREQTAKESLKEQAPAVSALGNTLVDSTKDVYANANIPTMERTELARVSAPERTAFDPSQYGRVDTSGITSTGDVARAGTYNPGEGAQFLSSLGQQLQAQSIGQGPSVASQIAAQNRESALAASLAQQASLRGGFDPAAARQIRQVAGDVQAQIARDEMTARAQEQLNAQQALTNVGSAIEDTGIAAAASDVAATGLEVQEKGIDVDSQVAAARTELEQRGQDIEMGQFAANLTSKETWQAVELELEQNFKDADLAQESNTLEFKAAVDMAMDEVNKVTNALNLVYKGNMAAMQADVNAYNDIVSTGLAQGYTMDQTRQAFEESLIREGKTLREAQLRADNAHQTAMTAYAQKVKDRQAGVLKGAVGLAGNIAGMVATGGLSSAAPTGGAGLGGLAPTIGLANRAPSPLTQTSNPATQVQSQWGLNTAPPYNGPMR